MKRVYGKICILYWYFIKEFFGVWVGKLVMTEVIKVIVWIFYKLVMIYI